MKLQPESTGRCLCVFCCWFGKNGIGCVDEQGNRTRRWDQLVQQLQLFRPQLDVQDGPACEIPARSVQTGDKTSFNWVHRSRKDDRNRRGCRLGCQQRRSPTRGDHCDLASNQTGGKRRQSIILFFRPVVLDGYILTLDKTGFLQTLAERGQIDRGRECAGRCAGEEADHRYRLLRVRGDRPCDASSAEKRDEVAASHRMYPLPDPWRKGHDPVDSLREYHARKYRSVTNFTYRGGPNSGTLHKCCNARHSRDVSHATSEMGQKRRIPGFRGMSGLPRSQPK